MHRNNSVEFRQGVILHRNDWAVVPTVVNQNTYLSKSAISPCERYPAVAFFCQVAGEELCAAAGLRDFRGGCRQFFFGACGQKNRSSFAGKCLCDGFADSAARSADECNFVFEHHGENSELLRACCKAFAKN